MKWIKSYPEMLSESSVSDLPAMQKKLINLIRHNEISRARDLINYGVEPNFFVNRLTPLDFAIRSASPEMVEMLIKSGAHVNEYNGVGITPLFAAAKEMRPEMVKTLIKNGADVNMTQKEPDSERETGHTALHEISYINPFSDIDEIKEIAQILIDNGLSLNQEDWKGWTPFQISIVFGNPELVQFYIDNGADINKGRTKGVRSSLVELAISKKFIPGETVNPRILQVLILNGVDFTKKFTTLDALKEFFDDDLSWYPGGEEGAARKYRSKEIRKNMF